MTEAEKKGALMLHITDGESVAGTLRESAVPGVVSTCGDMMYEGPAPAGPSFFVLAYPWQPWEA